VIVDIRLVRDRDGWWRVSVEGVRVRGRWLTRVSALSALADMMRDVAER
jgi:hypothetical protein